MSLKDFRGKFLACTRRGRAEWHKLGQDHDEMLVAVRKGRNLFAFEFSANIHMLHNLKTCNNVYMNFTTIVILHDSNIYGNGETFYFSASK